MRNLTATGNTGGLSIYESENARIGMVYSKVGRIDESHKFFEQYKSYSENDRSIYRQLNFTVYYAYMGDEEKALESFRQFSEEEKYHYWILLFMELDPIMDSIKLNPEFQLLLKNIDNRFSERQRDTRAALNKEGLI